MGAQAKTLQVWTDLEAAGGVAIGQIAKATRWEAEYRGDGDHRLTVAYPRAWNPTLGLSLGHVLRIDFEDGGVEEWITNEVQDDGVSDEITALALPVRTWFSERVLVRDSTITSFTWTGYLSDLLDTLFATDEWPSWAVKGTVSRNPYLTGVTVEQANGLEALLALLAAANANDEVKLFGETLRLECERDSGTQFSVSITSAAASGTPALVSGSNISPPRIRRSRSTQVQSVLPLGDGGADISEARYLVRSLNLGQKRLELRDWSYRADRLVIVYDGQWVGDYLVAPDGGAFQITDSFAATQEVECASIGSGDFGTDDFVRIASDSGGTAITEFGSVDESNRRRRFAIGTWTGKTNWARNAQWRDWSGAGGTLPADWTNGITGWTLSQNTNLSFVETGRYSLKAVTDGTAGTRTFTMNTPGWPAEVLSPGGGSQSWRVGMRYFSTVTSSAIRISGSVNGGGSWSLSGGSVLAGNWATAEITGLITSASTGPTDFQIRISTTQTSATFYVDRVWLLREGTDTGDNTLDGCDPARGVYEGNRLLQKYLGDVTYEFSAIDRYRATPAAFPHDRLEVNQLARLLYPGRSVDQVAEIVGLKIDYRHPYQTAVTIGALRRRLIDTLRS